MFFEISAQVLISCSLDWTIRLWNLHGNFIGKKQKKFSQIKKFKQKKTTIKGTFGQTIPWNLYDPATYQHPSVPLDILTDPRSLPVNQQKKEEPDSTDKSDKPSQIVRFYSFVLAEYL